MVEARGNVLVQGGHSPGGIDFILVLPVELFWATAGGDVGHNLNRSRGKQF